MDEKAKEKTIQSYRDLFLQYGDTLEAVQWSPEGQRFRFFKAEADC